jgi:hypothetical protein
MDPTTPIRPKLSPIIIDIEIIENEIFTHL